MNSLPGKILIKDYCYELPAGRIAPRPLEKRDESKLLIYEKGKISQSKFKNIPELLPQDSLLIFNDTKVINARILFSLPGGKHVEIFCLEPAKESDIQLAFQQGSGILWKCIVGSLKAWKEPKLEKKINEHGQDAILTVQLIEKAGDAFIIKFSWRPGELTFAEILGKFGVTPLPPYIKRAADKEDEQRYQTIYADTKGSVAAPTAGLHFTDEVFSALSKKGIKTAYVTLHVGAGTFKPVKSEDVSRHSMHSERFFVQRQALENILNHTGRIISVGTTTLRTIESLYWFGVQLLEGRAAGNGKVFISQWEPYGKKTGVQLMQSLEAVLEYMADAGLEYISGETEIIIVPGYEFKVFSGLITNFHQPGSTLLLLIAAFIGDDWKKAYEYALNNDFRFLSYGDSSLLLR